MGEHGKAITKSSFARSPGGPGSYDLDRAVLLPVTAK